MNKTAMRTPSVDGLKTEGIVVTANRENFSPFSPEK